MKVKSIIFSILFAASILTFPAQITAADDNGINQKDYSNYEKLHLIASSEGNVKVIVKLKVSKIEELTAESNRFCTAAPGLKSSWGGANADMALMDAITYAADNVLNNLSETGYRLNHIYSSIPYMALDVSDEALAILQYLPEVLDIKEDKPMKPIDPVAGGGGAKVKDSTSGTSDLSQPMLDDTVSIIGADIAWGMGYTGTGWYVAVLDTGIRSTHEFFQGKIIVEACFAQGHPEGSGDCPNGNSTMTGPGSAAHYSSSYGGYDHGTHVAGIATGNNGSLFGVAKEANIIAVQVFSKFPSWYSACDGTRCILSYDSDVLAGLDHIYSIRGSYSIASVNMSLGGGSYPSACNTDPRKAAIDNLRAVGIAAAIATGNDYYCGYVGAPACISTAVSVGSSTDNDQESWFNNWHPTLQKLFAPGSGVYSSTGSSNSSYESWNGTSMATPHVAGAWALLKQAKPTGTVLEFLTALQFTGAPVTSICDGYTIPIPRIQVDAALDELSTIIVTSPNGGEMWEGGSSHSITWSTNGNVGNVKIELSTNNGSSWSTIASSTANDGTFSWTVPNTSSTQCLVRISAASDSSLSDNSDNVFSIITSTLTVTSPNGGENWQIDATQSITWSTSGTMGNVKIELSTNNGSSWSTIASSTSNDGTYSWKILGTESSQCLVRISEASVGSPSDTSDAVFTIFNPIPPEIALSRTQLNFGALSSGIATGAQDLWLNNSGGGTLSWDSNSSASWLSCTPASGTNAGVLAVSVNPAGLAAGSHSGTITIIDADAANSPQTVTVHLNVMSASQDQPPFGAFSTPGDGTTVSSSVPMTGWVLDDVEVVSVGIYRGTGNNLDYVGEASFVEGARPDIISSYPGYPMSYKAGWGYMLLTYFLPDGGNGSYTLHAIATDKVGQQVTLGTTTIICNNTNAVKPFGAIDAPGQGGSASGSSFKNSGWVLTPMPYKIPEDGSTIDVYVDGKYLGHPVYNVYRSDIASFFPGYANSFGAHAYFNLDTTPYNNGVHSIYWIAADNAGNIDGIGSRYFNIRNVGSTGMGLSTARAGGPIANREILEINSLPVNIRKPVQMQKGYGEDTERQAVMPDEKGISRIRIKELERVVIQLSDHTPGTGTTAAQSRNSYEGWLVVGKRLKPLPVGSTLDGQKGIFYWQPGPGFIGEYRFVFIEKGQDKDMSRKNVIVKIGPRFE